MVRTAEKTVDTAMVTKSVMLRLESVLESVLMAGEMMTVKDVRLIHTP